MERSNPNPADTSKQSRRRSALGAGTFALLFTAALFAAPSCESTSEDDADTCNTTKDCPEGHKCVEGICEDGSGGTGGGGGGGGGGSGGSGGSGECKVELVDPTCNTCVRRECCASAETCLLDVSDCTDLLGCLGDFCADATDVDACMQENCSDYVADGLDPLNEYLGCVTDNCEAECTDPDECTVVLDDQDCSDCMAQNCCDLAEPCFTSGEVCNDLRECLIAHCADAPDINLCLDENCADYKAEGLPPFNEYLACLDTHCQSECAAGPAGTPSSVAPRGALAGRSLARPLGSVGRGQLAELIGRVR